MRRTVQTVLLLTLAATVSVGLRSWSQADQIFVDGEVRFQENDPWYHVRMIESTVAHFPARIHYDPYVVAPAGSVVGVAPLFDQLAAGLALTVGLGDPTPRQVHLVAAWLPVLFGVGLVPVVYLLGRRLFGRPEGWFAAGLVAVIPGALLRRTSLGYTDHHAAETFFAALTMLALVRALQSRQDDLSPRAARIRSALFGLCLAAYLLSWIGGPLLLLILAGWIALQLVVDRYRQVEPMLLADAVVPGLLVATLVLFPGQATRPYAALPFRMLVVLLVVLAALSWLSIVTSRRGWSFARFVTSLAAGVVIALALHAVIPGSPMPQVLAELQRFFAPGAGTAIREVRPLFGSTILGSFTALWDQFTSASILAGVGLLLLANRCRKASTPAGLLLLVWSVAMLVATLGRVRYAYYLAINVALLSGFTLHFVWRWALATKRPVAQLERRITAAVAIVAIGAFAFYPGLAESRRVAADVTGPSSDWLATMRWLRDETPPAITDAEYVAAHRRPSAADSQAQRPAAYSVMTWWDYGYWVLAARHVPTSNPSQTGAGTAAAFYLARSEEQGAAILDELDSRYVLVDHTMPMITPSGDGRLSGKFAAIAGWAGSDREEYFEPVLVPDGNGGLVSRTVFHPAYFESMLVRLYLFEGRPVDPGPTLVVAFRPPGAPGAFDGRSAATRDSPREIEFSRRFDSHEQARDFIAANPDRALQIVSDDPRVSCVPLEGLDRFRLAYASPGAIAHRGDRRLAFVEVFEYLGRSGS